MQTTNNTRARSALRSIIFRLIRDSAIGEGTGLHLLRGVEMALRDKSVPADIGVPHAMHIEDEDNPVSWRAYPVEETTIEQLMTACQLFDVQPYTDSDGRVCLIVRTPDAGIRPPTAMELVSAMYGLGDMAEWPEGERAKWSPTCALAQRQAD